MVKDVDCAGVDTCIRVNALNLLHGLKQSWVCLNLVDNLRTWFKIQSLVTVDTLIDSIDVTSVNWNHRAQCLGLFCSIPQTTHGGNDSSLQRFRLKCDTVQDIIVSIVFLQGCHNSIFLRWVNICINIWKLKANVVQETPVRQTILKRIDLNQITQVIDIEACTGTTPSSDKAIVPRNINNFSHQQKVGTNSLLETCANLINN